MTPRPASTWRACRPGARLSPRVGTRLVRATETAGSRQTAGLAPLAGADGPQAAALRLVKCEVAPDGDRDGGDDDPDPYPYQPCRQNEEKDQPDDNSDDPGLRARRHNDSIHLAPPGQTLTLGIQLSCLPLRPAAPISPPAGDEANQRRSRDGQGLLFAMLLD